MVNCGEAETGNNYVNDATYQILRKKGCEEGGNRKKT